jgi:hypothetical protein
MRRSLKPAENLPLAAFQVSRDALASSASLHARNRSIDEFDWTPEKKSHNLILSPFIPLDIAA